MSNDGERAADEHDERADGLRHDAGMCGACGTEFVMTAETGGQP